jgi:SAM-dependent methyltransferase
MDKMNNVAFSGAEELSWIPASWERMRYSTSYIGEKIYNKVVLDMGCSAGHQTLFMALCWQPKQIIGLDNFRHEGGAPHCRDEFDKMIEMSGCNNISIAVADAFNIPFTSESIDVLVSSQALHHFFVSKRDLRKLSSEGMNEMAHKMREWHRVLKPGGKLVIRDTSRYNLPRVLAKLGIPKSARRIDFKTKQEAQTWGVMLSKAGFHIDDIAYYVPYRLRAFASMLKMHAVNLFFNMTYFIQASPYKSHLN